MSFVVVLIDCLALCLLWLGGYSSNGGEEPCWAITSRNDFGSFDHSLWKDSNCSVSTSILWRVSASSWCWENRRFVF